MLVLCMEDNVCKGKYGTLEIDGREVEGLKIVCPDGHEQVFKGDSHDEIMNRGKKFISDKGFDGHIVDTTLD